MRCLLKQKRKSIPTLQDGDSHATSDKDKANLLNKFFVSQSQKSVGNVSEKPPSISLPAAAEDSSITHIQVTEEEVRKLLASIDTSKSPGADGVPSKALKVAAAELAPSLTSMFNQSLSSSQLPTKWTEATTRPFIRRHLTRTPPTIDRSLSFVSH